MMTTTTCSRPRCDGEVNPGIALAPVWGNHRFDIRNPDARGVTLYAVTGAVVTVAKCSECGHSTHDVKE